MFFCQGWHLNILFMVAMNPFIAPYLDMADIPYSEQVG